MLGTLYDSGGLSVKSMRRRCATSLDWHCALDSRLRITVIVSTMRREDSNFNE